MQEQLLIRQTIMFAFFIFYLLNLLFVFSFV